MDCFITHSQVIDIAPPRLPHLAPKSITQLPAASHRSESPTNSTSTSPVFTSQTAPVGTPPSPRMLSNSPTKSHAHGMSSQTSISVDTMPVVPHGSSAVDDVQAAEAEAQSLSALARLASVSSLLTSVSDHINPTETSTGSSAANEPGGPRKSMVVRKPRASAAINLIRGAGLAVAAAPSLSRQGGSISVRSSPPPVSMLAQALPVMPLSSSVPRETRANHRPHIASDDHVTSTSMANFSGDTDAMSTRHGVSSIGRSSSSPSLTRLLANLTSQSTESSDSSSVVSELSTLGDRAITFLKNIGARFTLTLFSLTALLI
jgi:hypothetical protein